MTMKRIGLIAGAGELPVEFARSARDRGEKVIVFALRDMASSMLEQEADTVHWLDISQYARFAFLLLKERVRKVAMVGKVDKNVLYRPDSPGKESYKKLIHGLGDRKDYSILEEVTRHLKIYGVTVVESTPYLSHLIPGKGILGNVMPSEDVLQDMSFGFEAARRLADMDIGQTVIVKGRSVVAVEAMEGTDAVIKRGAALAGEGCVMVKVSRSSQDMRWDVPTVGPHTVNALSSSGYSGLAVESGRMYVVSREETIRLADARGIAVQGV